MNILAKFFTKCYNVWLYRIWYGQICRIFWNHFYKVYRYHIRSKGRRIQKKEKIRVLFVLAELGAWKTEELYLAMKAHPRFESLIGITESQEVPGSKPALVAYVKEKRYDYYDLDAEGMDISVIKPDLLFYYKPYDGSYPAKHIFKRHLSSLPVFVNYGFNTISTKVHCIFQIGYYSWIVLVENQINADSKYKLIGKYASNVRVTGVPMQDRLCLSKEHFKDPWKDTKKRKRIIYAPHHSFKGTNGAGIEYATFLDFGEFMLGMAEKYKDQVYWAFKPHPTLYRKLLKKWGKERTDAYYERWRSMECSQVELGEYVGLFKHSDAMIHDCASFQVEYHFTTNPVLYLNLGGIKIDNLNKFGLAAFELSYQGHSKEDIEQFILDVIHGKDVRKQERQDFYNHHLLPPFGKTACENIISTILNDHTL